MSAPSKQSRQQPRVNSPERMKKAKNERNFYAIDKGFGDVTMQDTIDTSIPIGTHSNARLSKRHKLEDVAPRLNVSMRNYMCCVSGNTGTLFPSFCYLLLLILLLSTSTLLITTIILLLIYTACASTRYFPREIRPSPCAIGWQQE
jgi:hypothetical protein